MDIELKRPWVLDLTTKFDKQLSQFGGSRERLLEFYKKFGADGVIYDGNKRWGLDSSTDSSDISYDDLDEGNELWWRKIHCEWLQVRVGSRDTQIWRHHLF